MAVAGERLGIGIHRYFTTESRHPYDEVVWERRDSRITDYRTGAVAFEQVGVEVPSTWSLNATNILAQKYFRGTVGMAGRESSLRQVVDRVVDTITAWGLKDGYFVDAAEAATFNDELKHLVVQQKAAFNSPVWFNIGVEGVPQQAAACFILAVEDSMSSILNWYVEEGTIFKGGSGAGVNLSNIRSSRELLHGGGTASGPVSFMRGADASAGTIKSGGKTRRAAKMVILDIDHPDIQEFIWCKAREERKARALAQAGFDMDLDGRDSHSLQYQNANNSVRVTDEFMQAVLDDSDWDLIGRTSAWECADPGMQFDTTINKWHTAPNTGRITASNPCSEYVHLDNSSCNLASLNLMGFLNDDDTFDVTGFQAAVAVVFTAQEILVGNADYGPGRAVRLGRGPRHRCGDHSADDGRGVRDLGSHGSEDGTVRRLPRERGPDAERSADAPPRGGQDRRGAGADGAALRGTRGLGHRSRDGRSARRAQCPSDGAGTYGHDLVSDGLRHDGDRARPRACEDEEARRGRNDVDRQPDRSPSVEAARLQP